jgi:exopolysaccharide biosynthesis polyprenyl glycosylphosphotransferase
MTLAQQTESLHAPTVEQLHSLESRKRREWTSRASVEGQLLILDAVTLPLTGILILPSPETGVATPYYGYFLLLLGAMLLLTGTSWLLGGYATDANRKISASIKKLVPVYTFTFLTALSAATIIGLLSDQFAVWFFPWMLLSLVSMSAGRTAFLLTSAVKAANGAGFERALIVDCFDESLDTRQSAFDLGQAAHAVARINITDPGLIGEIRSVIHKIKPDAIIVRVPWAQIGMMIPRLNLLVQYPLDVFVVPADCETFQKSLRLCRQGDRTLLQIIERPLNSHDALLKRLLDVSVASVALLLTSPLLALIAILIKLESKGPVLFKQIRVGLGGEFIEVWKFRSMYAEATDPHAQVQTSRNDPRVTRMGRLIRRTSLDELPQFWNVLSGQMSIVGPRPHALATFAEGKRLDAIVEEYGTRHRVKPGITGWAQVNGARGELCTREHVERRVQLDLYYINHWSIFFDVKIIVLTFVRVFHDPYAY